MRQLTPAEARAFLLERPRTAKLASVRADGRASYAIVAQVMAALSTSGFSSINLITDTGGPSSGPKPLQPAPEPSAP